MWGSMRRHIYMMPFFFAAFHNRPPLFNANGDKVHQNTAISSRRDLRDRGLVADVFYDSAGGDDYIERYGRMIFDRPMFFFTDRDGEFQIVPDAATEHHTLRHLCGMGLGTPENLGLTRRFDWYAAKIKTVEGTNFVRTELRDIDSSAFSAQSLAVYAMLTAFDSGCADEVDQLLRSFGFDDTPAANRAMIEEQLEDVKNHADRFFDRPYGTGHMSDFAREFISVISRHAGRYGIDQDVLEPLRFICETGTPEARVIDEECRTFEDVVRLQDRVTAPLYEEPNQSIGLLRERGMKLG